MFQHASIEEFSKAVKKAIKSEVTTVIDVPVSSKEKVLPMVPVGAGLKGVIESEEEM